MERRQQCQQKQGNAGAAAAGRRAAAASKGSIPLICSLPASPVQAYLASRRHGLGGSWFLRRKAGGQKPGGELVIRHGFASGSGGAAAASGDGYGQAGSTLRNSGHALGTQTAPTRSKRRRCRL